MKTGFKRAKAKLNFNIIKGKILFKNLFAEKAEAPQYLFILCPNFSGSTLLTKILETSPNVSVNNPRGSKEGQKIPEVKNMMFKKTDRWDPENKFDWNYIKKIWHKYWDETKSLLVEKSPADIVRANEIDKYFYPVKYLTMVRNPYAHIESLMRREKRSIENATEFSLKCLEFQRNNIENLNNKNLFFSYENLTNNPDSIKDKILEFIPELTNINVKNKFSDHTKRNDNQTIRNLNADKINKLSREQLDRINKTLLTRKDLLDYFGYNIV